MPSLCWAAGMHDFTLAALWAGGTVILNPSGGLDHPRSSSPSSSEEQDRPGPSSSPPCSSRWSTSADAGHARPVGSMELRCYTGAEPVPVPVIEKCQRLLPRRGAPPGLRPLRGTGHRSTWLRGEDAVRKIGSCGKPVHQLPGAHRRRRGQRPSRAGSPASSIVRSHAHHGRLLAPPRGQRRDAAQRLAPHRRPRHHGRRGLPHHLRPQEGHVHLRRPQRVPRRGRGGHPRRRRRRRVRGGRRCRTTNGARSGTRWSWRGPATDRRRRGDARRASRRRVATYKVPQDAIAAVDRSLAPHRLRQGPQVRRARSPDRQSS